MIELDAALRVVGMPSAQSGVVCPSTTTTPAPAPRSSSTPEVPVNTGTDDIDWGDFVPSCSNGICGLQTCGACSTTSTKPAGGCTSYPGKTKKPKPKPAPLPSITPEFLHNLVALKKLADITSLEILNLLTFWGTINTAGTLSLYGLLFLTHNILRVDRVFVPDTNGKYLVATPAPKIVHHIPILLAAFRLKIKDFNDLMGANGANIITGGTTADLTLENVSTIYRYVLLGRILGIKPALIPMVFTALKTERLHVRSERS
jgi:hypothetical protein